MPRTLLTDAETVHLVDRTSAFAHPAGAVVATDDEEVIRDWAARHNADPATGEATRSGPATVTITDRDAGIRFNFPGVARYRPISWQEWFENFHRHDLLFVYEREDPSGRYRVVSRDAMERTAAAASANSQG